MNNCQDISCSICEKTFAEIHPYPMSVLFTCGCGMKSNLYVCSDICMSFLKKNFSLSKRKKCVACNRTEKLDKILN